MSLPFDDDEELSSSGQIDFLVEIHTTTLRAGHRTAC